MIERKTQELNTAMQLYKHDNHIVFRIYAQVNPLQKHLNSIHSIYEIAVQLIPPYACYQHGTFARNFTNREIGFSILLERTRTYCKQFGFKVPYHKLRRWEELSK